MRAPFQVLTVPYRVGNADLEFLLLRREDLDVWQWVAGGGEEGESPQHAAERELAEELDVCGDVFSLQSRATIPSEHIVGDLRWGPEKLVLIEHAFCVDVGDRPTHISDEHTQKLWADFTTAWDLLAWDSNRTAMWEVRTRHEHDWWIPSHG